MNGSISLQEIISRGLGAVSIICWLFVFVPQFYKNYQRSSVSGISILFLILWLVGDTANFIGGIMARVVPMLILQAVYFIVADILLIGQFIYYDKIRPYRRRSVALYKRLQSSPVSSEFGSEPLIESLECGGNGDGTMLVTSPISDCSFGVAAGTVPTTINTHITGLSPTCLTRPLSPLPLGGTGTGATGDHALSPRAMSTYHVTTTFNRETSTPETSKSFKKVWKQAMERWQRQRHGRKCHGKLIMITISLTCILTTLVVIWCKLYASLDAASPLKQFFNGSLPENYRKVIAGTLGYASAASYLLARIPQIWHHYRTRKCEGLSLALMKLSMLGNVTGGMGILVHSTDLNYLWNSMPWLLGTFGTICEDAILMAQYYHLGPSS